MFFSLFKKHYSVRFRLMIFLVIVTFFISLISITAVISLNTTYQSLSDLRDRSLNQMFSSMTLGVKTAQISTYAKRLTQTTEALAYKEESKALAKHAEELQQLLQQASQDGSEHGVLFYDIAKYIGLLEKSIQELLLQSHKRHILQTDMLSRFTQSLLHIRHIKRLQKQEVLDSAFILELQRIEKLIENAAQGQFSANLVSSIQNNLKFIPSERVPEFITEELSKLKAQVIPLADRSKNLVEINLRIKFLVFQIDAFVKNINQQYAQLSQSKVEQVQIASDKIQQRLYRQILSILGLGLFTILLIAVLGKYIYSLIGTRLFSITEALKKLSQGDKSITVPQQHNQDEIGDLARTFDVFHRNVVTLERTDSLLKEKNELLEQTFLAMRDGLAIFDSQFNLVSYNAQFKFLLQDFFQTYEGQLTLYTLVDFFNIHRSRVLGSEQIIDCSLLKQARQEQGFLEIECQKRILEWRVSPLKDGLVAFLIDRTERKKLESEIAHSQKMQAIGHLTGGIAHDFNNFLAVIIGNLDLIDLDTLSERQAKRLQRALKAAENSATLTQRLLAYARKQPLHPTNLDVNQLITDLTDLMKHTVPSTIEVRLELAGNLADVYIDKSQLETALVNLIINAKDALNNEGVIIIRTIQLNVQRTHWKEKMVQISIIDNGCGMAPDIQKKVFEPFFTTKKGGKGSGLGLSMVYGFIRQSKGRVKIESEVNKGTTIHLQLPIAHMPTKVANLVELEKQTNAQYRQILLVEDKVNVRETLAEQLHELGYRVLQCESAEQAISIFSEGIALDYLLSDIMLTGKLTGVDLAKWVTTSYPQVKILLMTGHTEQKEKAEQFPLLVKPFKQIELQQKLTAL